MNQPSKICPACQAIAPLAAEFCVNCAHKFRTQFTPPVSDPHLSLPQLSPLQLPVPVSAPAHAGRRVALGVVAAICVLTAIGLAALLSRRPAAAPSAFASSEIASSEMPVAGSADPATPNDSAAPSRDTHPASTGVADIGQAVAICDDGVTMRSHIAMALKDPADLDLWQKTLGARGYGGEDASQLDTPDDTYTQDRMVQMGRIVVLEDDTPARLLSVVNNVAQVEITDGVNKGITGMVSKYCLYRGGSGDTQIYKMQFYHSPESPQRPDGSFAPMAGIDYPADANHPPGSINHEIVPDRHSPTP